MTEQEQVLERGAKAEDVREGLFGPHGVLLGYTVFFKQYYWEY